MAPVHLVNPGLLDCNQNIVSDVAATCVSETDSLEEICGQIVPNADLLTMFSRFSCYFRIPITTCINEIM